ncbi:hypothetical protein I3U76_01905 [Mycobacteroides abscessus subsp. abscessus]|uniref:hypothetical protein n=1 Tax=Mycobacteroides abscessus TaxID=36809 RepID=UPI001038D004|nr:hypothetical protein [Mycobacteroides abscessus]MBN7289645.1 hypothetical protein [Mycobacteroides abscessus subsp. abscessus]MBN7295788.1 hypothetical protein [Mycobacteroides abscessus subsp. abscessus]QSN15211.1 hypothetical protein I3U32_20035 [Mycobacteroides abscessus subsp. abscessus]
MAVWDIARTYGPWLAALALGCFSWHLTKEEKSMGIAGRAALTLGVVLLVVLVAPRMVSQ